MKKKEIMIIVEDSGLTLEELCDTCDISSDLIQDFIAYDIIQPAGAIPEEWIFDLMQLQRIKTAIRLQSDLEVNLAGVAVILDLMDEIEALRKRTELLEKHFMK